LLSKTKTKTTPRPTFIPELTNALLIAPDVAPADDYFAMRAIVFLMRASEFDVFTFGFSARSWEETVAILQTYAIARLVDIRTMPGSRFAPQFNQEQLTVALPAADIEYIHMKELGGLRKSAGDNPATAAWQNASFRAYADYMQTGAFDKALTQLIGLLEEKRTVYACTEAVFWRCHRALVSDALATRGYRPGHIFSADTCKPHQITSFARIIGTRPDGMSVTYPK
jgi:uncharacterized protein (DUF488 family)